MTLHPESSKALEEISSRFRKTSQRVVFVSGNFNILHPGHLRLLRFASECGDLLIVGVLSDQLGNALLPEDLRLESVRSNSWVDYAFILKDTPQDFIGELKPDVVVKGKEHENSSNPELEVVQSYGGKLRFGSGDISFSSVDLLRKEFQDVNFSTIIKPTDFPQRHGFDIDSLADTVNTMNSLRICVVGETIVDEYITCDPLGMSQEDPTIVVTPVLEQQFLGGAGIVAAHAAGLGATVHFFSILGNDETASFVRTKTQDYGIDSHFFIDESRPTIKKQRFRSNGKTLLRVSHLRNHPIDKEIRQRMLDEIGEALQQTDLLIFSDFNYGCLPQALVDEITIECKKNKVMVVADSQCSSQIGDVSRFQGMKLLTPTEREARLSVRDFDSGLVVLAESLRIKAQCEFILMTLGKEGVLIHANTKDNKWLTDRLPSFNTSSKDSAGAGDSLLTCTSMALALGVNIWQSAYLGSLAAACQVGRLGNIPLKTTELLNEL